VGDLKLFHALMTFADGRTLAPSLTCSCKVLLHHLAVSRRQRLGKNVFFLALLSFVPQDYGLFDIYDARVGGGFAEPPPISPPCEGEACQSPPPAPEDPTPASSIYSGPGNLKPVKGCPKGKHKKNGKCVRKYHKKKHKRHHKRGAKR
jgi:hypothetical protein